MRQILFIFFVLAVARTSRAADHAEPTFRGKTLTQWSHALDEPNAEIRVRAADAIAQIGIAARSATPQLARLLSDPDPRVRLAAAVALEAMGPAARTAVGALAGRCSIRTRIFAAGRLFHSVRSAPKPPPLLQRWRRWSASLIATSPRPPRKLWPRLGPMQFLRCYSCCIRPPLRGANWHRFRLATCQVALSAASSSLLELLDKDPEASVRAAAAQALGANSPTSGKAVIALTAALRDPHQRVRLASARCSDKSDRSHCRRCRPSTQCFATLWFRSVWPQRPTCGRSPAKATVRFRSLSKRQPIRTQQFGWRRSSNSGGCRHIRLRLWHRSWRISKIMTRQ